MPQKRKTIKEIRKQHQKERNDLIWKHKLKLRRLMAKQKFEIQKHKEKRMPTTMRTARRTRR